MHRTESLTERYRREEYVARSQAAQAAGKRAYYAAQAEERREALRTAQAALRAS